jgi:hypothetical protein
MATKEVDEAQWNSAQNVVRSVSEIMKDPNRRLKLLELQKEAEPNAVIPEIDARKPFEEAVSGIKKNLEELRSELQAEREKRDNDKKLTEFTKKWEDGRAFLRKHGYNDDGIGKIEKLMEDRGIANHEDAGRIYEQLFPPQQPMKSGNTAVTQFINSARTDGGADELTKQLIASKGQDNFVLDRMIDEIRREGQ